MAYTVAEAEVLLLPNAQNFGKTAEAQITAQADEIGRKAGDAIGDQMKERIRLALAELPDAHLDLDTSRADEALDRWVAEAEVKARVGGQSVGREMGSGAAEGASSVSPLIVAAIAGGLVAGGPLVAAAGGGLMAALAAVIVHNSPEVTSAATDVADKFKTAFLGAADSTIPYFTKALQDVGDAAHGLAAQAAPAFQSLEQPIQHVADGVLGLATNAMPGLTRMIQTSAPIFSGLDGLLTSIGTGLGRMFTIISQHADAGGTVLSSLGTALDGVLSSLGSLVGAGADLGQTILPPLAVALEAVAKALEFMGPVLPGVLAALIGMKVAGTLGPIFATLATWLSTTGVNAALAAGEMLGMQGAGIAAGVGMEAAAAGARGLEAAMGPIGLALAAITLIIPGLVHMFGSQDDTQKKVKASAEAMTQALQTSKGAIDENVRSQAALEAQKDGLLDWAKTWGVSAGTVVDAITGNSAALDTITAKAQGYSDAQNNMFLSADKSTSASLMQAQAHQQNAAASDEAAKSLGSLAGATTDEVGRQKELADAMDSAADATEANNNRLAGLSAVASAANTAVSQLKGALDALSGKAVSMGDAEVAVTQAVSNASGALKGQEGALTDASGALDKHTAKGAAAWQALTALKDASNTLIGTMEQQGSTTDEVSKKDAELRQTFIDTAKQMGFSQTAAENLANEILGIPAQRTTEIQADTAAATAAVKTFEAYWTSISNRKVTLEVGTKLAPAATTWIGGGATRIGAQAAGHIVHAFADGGMEPMQGGLAQIVPPNTWRVIGDRPVDDEAYIPINDSARSQALLATTAGRMGYQLSSPGQGGGAPTTVIAQFGSDTLEATAVRVVNGALSGMEAAARYGMRS